MDFTFGLTRRSPRTGRAPRPSSNLLSAAAAVTTLETLEARRLFSLSLSPVSTFNVGQGSKTIAVADINGDGKNDLVIADYKDALISVLLGNDNGTFGPPITYAVGNDPTSVAVGDVNGDGNADVVVTNYKDNSVSVLLGQGDGTLGPQTSYATGEGPQAVTLADMNGDGRPDIILANDAYTVAANGTVSVLLNEGGGQFNDGNSGMTGGGGIGIGNTLPSNQYFVDGHPQAIAVADLANNGINDIITADAGTNDINVIVGNGDGTFQPHLTFATGVNPTGVVVADLNSDGKLDVATCNAGDNTVSFLAGNANGTFAAATSFAVGSDPRSISVNYLNGNNQPTLAVSEFGTNSVGLLQSNGDGTFQTEVDVPVDSGSASSIGSTSITLADINGDGTPDVVLTNYYARSISVFTNQTPQTQAVASLLNGVLQVNGSTANDTITVSESASAVTGAINGVAFGPFSTAAVHSVNIAGFDGADNITIGAGVPSTFVNGGAGNDTLVDNNAAGSFDTLSGAGGADSITGGAGRDDLNGGKGSDTLVAGTGNDSLRGGRGLDSLMGGLGSDLLIGGLGRDTLMSDTSATAVSTLLGGAGNDSILANAQDSVDGGIGNNTIHT